ncbi:MAG: PASTA domain-containing protein [Actinomycetota bacterium]|nr:PASTA domain-containing protein [Actinomycetota bacterium]
MLERRPVDKQRQQRYRLPVDAGAGVLGAFVLAIVVLLVVVALWATQGQSRVEVPVLVGLPRSQAETLLKNMGLNLRATSDQVSAQPAGTVLRTDPAAGVKLDPGASVSLIVAIAAPSGKASGIADVPPMPEAATAQQPAPVAVPAPVEQPAPVVVPSPVVVPPPVVVRPPVVIPPPSPALRQVPDLIGADRIRAGRVLRDAGLSVGSVTEEVSNQPAGTVLRTNPKAGSAVWPGSAIDLIIAKRGSQVKVPNVVGMDRMSAARALRDEGLTVGPVSEVMVPNQPAGRVLRTDPAAGTPVPAGTAVDLVVTAKAPPAKPDSNGQSNQKPKSEDADGRNTGIR